VNFQEVKIVIRIKHLGRAAALVILHGYIIVEFLDNRLCFLECGLHLLYEF